MKGTLHKIEHLGWVVRWNEAHYTGHNKSNFIDTPLGSGEEFIHGVEENKEVYFEIDFRGGIGSVAHITNFDHEQVEIHTRTELEKRLYDLLVEYRHALHMGDKTKADILDYQIQEIEDELAIREKLEL